MTAPDPAWTIACRKQQYLAEGRVNLLRAVAVAAFYAVETAAFYDVSPGFFELTSGGALVHRAVTGVVVLWAGFAFTVAALLRLSVFPPAMPYLTTAADVFLLTGALAVSSGPKSPLVAGYFLILVLASLRFDRRLAAFATAAAVLGYLALCYYARYVAPDRELRVPRYHQVMVLLAVVLTGVVLAEVARLARLLAEEYARRVGAGGKS
jgi:hypothetical protein